jgi:subtilisin family serine protease
VSRILLAIAVLAVMALSLSTVGRAQQPAPDAYVPGELIVQFRSGVTEAARTAVRAAHGAQRIRRYDRLRSEQLRIPAAANPIALARAFALHPEVEAAQPNYIRHAIAAAPPNDPYWVNGSLWGLEKIDAAGAWNNFGAGATTVVVADIDTGVNYNHPDLAANVWKNPGEIPGNGIDDDGNGYRDDVYGIDSANGDSDPIDDQGHGTHTAGTIGAVRNNSIGVAGASIDVRILACKFLTSQGTGSDADAVECFNYVVDMKQRGVNVRVTSNSWGGRRDGSDPTVLKNAIDAAGNAGILNVFAAGNDGVDIDSTPYDPASLTSPSIVAVAASDRADARASFSNYGAVSVDLAAPGVDILSTYQNGYAWASGTSMATPHVAGIAALLLSHEPSFSVAQVKDALLRNVDTLGQWSGLVATGGRLNAYHTLSATAGTPVPANQPPQVQITSPASGSTWRINGPVTLKAAASDPDDGVARVAFFAGTQSLGNGTLVNGVYTISWTPTAQGTYALTARAYDTSGSSTTSATVSVRVKRK